MNSWFFPLCRHTKKAAAGAAASKQATDLISWGDNRQGIFLLQQQDSPTAVLNRRERPLSSPPFLLSSASFSSSSKLLAAMITLISDSKGEKGSPLRVYHPRLLMMMQLLPTHVGAHYLEDAPLSLSLPPPGKGGESEERRKKGFLIVVISYQQHFPSPPPRTRRRKKEKRISVFQVMACFFIGFAAPSFTVCTL